MKKRLISSFLVLVFAPMASCFAADASRGKYGSDPVTILDRVVQSANQDYKIQQTALDSATDKQGSYQSQYKIANTLDWLKNNIAPYLQWMVYIGLAAATILLIYNGLLMVTNSLHGTGDITKLKKNIGYIIIGVIILTGFYFIIRLVVALLSTIFGDYSSSGGM